jgi:hypothetical protein
VALAIQGDTEALARLAEGERDGAKVDRLLQAAGGRVSAPAVYRVAYERQRFADELLADAFAAPGTERSRWSERLGGFLSRPATGVPVLVLRPSGSLQRRPPARHAGPDRDPALRGAHRPWLERAFSGAPGVAAQLFVGDYSVLTAYVTPRTGPAGGRLLFPVLVLEDTATSAARAAGPRLRCILWPGRDPDGAGCLRHMATMVMY